MDDNLDASRCRRTRMPSCHRLLLLLSIFSLLHRGRATTATLRFHREAPKTVNPNGPCSCEISLASADTVATVLQKVSAELEFPAAVLLHDGTPLAPNFDLHSLALSASADMVLAVLEEEGGEDPTCRSDDDGDEECRMLVPIEFEGRPGFVACANNPPPLPLSHPLNKRRLGLPTLGILVLDGAFRDGANKHETAAQEEDEAIEWAEVTKKYKGFRKGDLKLPQVGLRLQITRKPPPDSPSLFSSEKSGKKKKKKKVEWCEGTLDFRGTHSGAFPCKYVKLLNKSDTDYPAHAYPLLTPQIRTTKSTWHDSGLLARADERILFIQDIRPGHCLKARELYGDDEPFQVFGNHENTGISGGVRFLLRRSQAAHVLILERDFAVGPAVLNHADGGRQRLAAVLDIAQGLLASRKGAKATTTSSITPNTTTTTITTSTNTRDRPPVERVLLRHTAKMGRGFGGLNNVCESDDSLRRAFYPTDVSDDDLRQHSREKCVASNVYLDKFLTATSAMDFCPAKIVAQAGEGDDGGGQLGFGRYVQRCGTADVEVHCYGGEISHWTNNPTLARREWLLEHFVPLLPDCPRGDWECLYSGGIETNRELQCVIRNQPHTVAQTTGLFRHLDPHWRTRAPCAAAEGYWWPDRQQCRVWS